VRACRIFKPDDEPYLGRPLLHHFDLVIVAALEQQHAIGPWTRSQLLQRTRSRRSSECSGEHRRAEASEATYSVSKDLDSPEKADNLATHGAMYLIVLTARAAQIFPEATTVQES
jgi:hypothetical protein